MAINIAGFTAWITIEGLPSNCPIYGFRQTRAKRTIDAFCWIPSQEGKKFSVNWSNSHRDRPIFAQLSIDGVVCSTHFMLDALNHPTDADAIGISYATTSDFTRRDFVFQAIQVTDDDAYLYTLDSPPAFGTIRLELWEATIEQIRRAPFQHTYGAAVLESQVIHEKSKKAGAHHVEFGGEYVVPQTTVNMVNGMRAGDAPLATFTFNYRPYDILMAGGIIPRPVAVPRQQAPVKAESVDDEIHVLEARLESLRSQRAGGSSGNIISTEDFAHRMRTQWDSRLGKAVQVIDLTDL
ncbi:hypothetical protein DFH07DRAFT_878481 [Mycena maculata]|uniref:DUF7918 domain-containing protein n=1 Tax=Mycena maculata TaxID=230809 RepID=A0AAD7JVX1_9AGAR|nr:hypothetical protein DFH07DRAFT_878481 [Mycena maculata]